MNAQILALVNQKGGTAKTTSTVNLGVGLAQAGNMGTFNGYSDSRMGPEDNITREQAMTVLARTICLPDASREALARLSSKVHTPCFHIRFFRPCNVHIFADHVQRSGIIMTPAAHDPLLQFFRLRLQSVLPQGTGGDADQIEDIAVLANELAVRLLRRRLLDETAQLVGDIVTEPRPAKFAVGDQPPHGKLPAVQLYPVEGEQQICQIAALETRS